MLEKIEGAIKNGQSIDTCNIGHKTTQNEDKQDYKHNTENYKDEQYGPHYCMFIIYHLRFFYFPQYGNFLYILYPHRIYSRISF
jgi:hypothetical protein